MATPGRLLDLIGQGYVTLDTIRFFVLDEADRMLDMGFIHDIRRILPLLPERRQTLFFSATMLLVRSSTFSAVAGSRAAVCSSRSRSFGVTRVAISRVSA